MSFVSKLLFMKTEQLELSEQMSIVIYLLQECLDSQKAMVEWIAYEDCKEFFGYGSTQMASLVKSGGLVVTQVGRRKFISRKSLLSFLEKHIVKD
jgi:hypothetical protein